MDNGSNFLLVQNVAGTERIGLSHSKVAWLMVQEILDNGSILFLTHLFVHLNFTFSHIDAVIKGFIFINQLIFKLIRFQKIDHVKISII